ncbi:unnamed protein product [Prorocentrum cordatum]|uniref:Uncharacterized protein n=1 Tax=Prorocentrum cordatum TaxID=2364126 RepID=A0ABN9T6Z0_9DINO|nr:unnamed protein product [Polarella glacialis]
MTPFNEGDEEGAGDLLRMYRDDWTRPYMRQKRLRLDPAKPHISQAFTSAMERGSTAILDMAGGAKEQNGKVERHGQWFAQMLRAVVAEVQPQDRGEWRGCVAQVQEAKNSLLSVGGESPAQIVFGRNPEVPEELLVDSPDIVANGAVLRDPPAIFAARVRAIARRHVLSYNDRRATRAALDARPRRRIAYKPGDMVAIWRKVTKGGGGGLQNRRARYRWRPGVCMGAVRGNYWIAVPGCVLNASPEQLRMANSEERAAWRLVESSLRSHTIDLDSMKAQHYHDISAEERPPEEAEEEAEQTQESQLLKERPRPVTATSGNLEDTQKRQGVKRGPSPSASDRVKQPKVQLGLAAAAAEDSEDDDEILAVDEEKVLLARGRKELNRKEPKKLAKGYAKEYDKMINKTTAWRPRPLEESRRLRSTKPGRILKPRRVLTERGDEVKCRMTIQGFKDLDLLGLVRAGGAQAPTLSSNGRALVLQTIASAKFPMAIGDVEGASLETDACLTPAEHGTIYVSLPSEFLPEGVHEDQLCEVINGCGRSDQPQLRWLTFSKYITDELGFMQHPLDQCAMMLFEDIGETVDFDLGDYRAIEGSGLEGEVPFWKWIAKLKAKFPFWKWNDQEGEFVASKLQQLSDYTIVQSQRQYANEEMERMPSPCRQR